MSLSSLPNPDWLSPGLYIHIPFCASRCTYCDFCSTVPSRKEEIFFRYILRLKEDFRHLVKKEKIERFSTVFIGGGTPSFLGPKYLGEILSLLSPFAENLIELSIELNPDSTTLELLTLLADFKRKIMAKAGRMRLSFGVQTLDNKIRLALNRRGTGEEVLVSLDMLKDFPDLEYSFDIMAGLPMQTESGLISDIESLLSYKPKHISLYSLILAEDTPLESAVGRGEYTLPDEDALVKALNRAGVLLEGAGLSRYEVANYASGDAYARHNLRYWQMADWYALGPAAVGSVFNREAGTSRRYSEIADISRWLSGPSSPETEEISRRDSLFEFLMMGFRLIAGPDKKEFLYRWGIEIEEAIPKTLAKAKRDCLLAEDNLSLNTQGLSLLNRFLIDCMEELETFPL